MERVNVSEDRSTAEAILDVAQQLVQTRGYNAFSYKDIAVALGIRTASIHYHFPTKTDLGTKVAARYRDRFIGALKKLDDTEPDAMRRLDGFAGLFQSTLEVGNRLCLCGMMSAEIATLPDPVAAEVERFFRDVEAWLTAVLEAGRRAKLVSFIGSPADQAHILLATLEGAMIVTRGLRESDLFRMIARSCLDQLRPCEPVTA